MRTVPRYKECEERQERLVFADSPRATFDPSGLALDVPCVALLSLGRCLSLRYGLRGRFRLLYVAIGARTGHS